MPDRTVKVSQEFHSRTSADLHPWNLDLDTQIARLKALNRSEAELAQAIRVMIDPSATGKEH
jgi:hypothetical protein